MNNIELLVKEIVNDADQKKATNIVAYNVQDESSVTDFIVLIGVKNVIQCKAILLDIEKKISEYISQEESDDFYLPRVSGKPESEWVVLDINSIVVHIISEEKRQFYLLDEVFEKKAIIYHY